MSDAPIRFQSPSEFHELPGFALALECGKDDLRRLVGVYEWDEPRAQLCGVNDCGRKHWHGYVIEVADGRKTLLGQDCGRTKFGLLLKEFENALTQQFEDLARAENLAAMLAERQATLAAADALALKVRAVAAEVKAVMEILDKEPELRRVFGAALRDGGRIRAEVDTSRETRSAMRQSNAKVDLRTIGVIAGGEVVDQYVSALALLRSSTIAPLRALTEESLSGLSGKALRAKSREITNARDGLRRAEAFLANGARFLALSNLRELAKLGELLRTRTKTDRTMRILRRFAGKEQGAA